MNKPSLDELSIDIKFAGGQIFKHTPKVYLDPPSFSQEVEIGISHRTFGKRTWEAQNNFPIPSINFAFLDFRDTAFGKAFAFYPAIEYNILRRKNIACRVKFGGGLAYAQEHWERSDTLNNYIGSALNNFTLIQLGANYIISKNVELQVGGRLSHLSNGTFRQPNFGINNTTAYLGMNYYPVSTKLPYNKESIVPRAKHWYIGLRTGVSYSEINVPDGPMLPIYSLSVYASNTFLQKHRYFFGADATYNTRKARTLQYSFSDQEVFAKKAWNSSVFGGLELLYGKVGIPLQIGIYTKQMPDVNKAWYQKVGMSYYFFQKENYWVKKAFASAILKTHTQNADNIEICLGVLF